MNSLLLVLVLAAAPGSEPANVDWQVERTGTRTLELAARLDGPAARLVPAPGGILPGVEVLGSDASVSFGPVVRAAGVELVQLRVEPGDEAEVRLRLRYERQPEVDGRDNAMALMMAALALGEPPEYRLESPGYLIIVPDDFEPSIDPLAAWRKRCGYQVEVRRLSQTGSTKEEIQAYIANAYATWDPAPSYVVLAGAVSKIPAFITAGTPCVTDHPYACVDGDDFLADLFVGRLAAANASELDVIVAKIVGYESEPYVAETGWFRRALMVGTSYQEGGTPAVTALQTKRLIRERLQNHGFGQVDTVFYPPTRYGRGPVDSAVNRGVSFVNGRGWGNYDGWGYPQYLTNDVYALQNGWRLPVVTSIYCGTGNYARNPCFGEAWIRAGTPTSPKGAVAFWGSSWTGTSTRWNNCMDFGIYHAILEQRVLGCGPAMYLGKLAQYENFPLPSDSEDLRLYFHVYNLLGDPALAMRDRVPRTIQVSHPPTHPAGASSFEVAVAASGSPVVGALVCLSGASVQVVERTDASGRARFAVAASGTDTIHVTVTGDNLLTYSGSSRGIQAGVFVGHSAHSPDTVNAGAALNLQVTLRNFGTGQSAPGVRGVLRSLDGLAVVTDSSQDFGTIPAGGTAGAQFGVSFSPACTSSSRPRFELLATSDDSNWTSAFECFVSGPTLDFAGLTVHDANGWLDPGETAELSVSVENRGATAAAGVVARLRSPDPAIAVIDSIGSFGAIPAGDTVANTGDRFRVSAQPGIGRGRVFSLRLVLVGTGIEQEREFPITVGEPVSTAPLGPDEYGYWAFDNTDAGYEPTPSFQWVEIDPAHGGSGTRLALTNDTALPVRLPFTFSFYGRDYDTVSVSDNGYAVFGRAWRGEIYNWHIPSAAGPDGFVAGFWDDFRADTAQASGVYTWHDAPNHRFVIEWSRCHHVHGYRPPSLAELQTFQVILEDPAHHATPTGDGQLVVQLLEVQNDDSLFANSHNFATIGIQSPDDQDGIEYTFAGRYPSAAAPAAPGRAIRFTTTPPDTFTGVREGRVGERPVATLDVTPSLARGPVLVRVPAPGVLRVFDASGREVRRMAATGTMRWDLCDRSGARVPAGVYYFQHEPYDGPRPGRVKLCVTATD